MLTRIERAARREPALYCYGTTPPKKLTAAEEALAPFEDRFRSNFRYLSRRAKVFAEGLGERERASYGADDVLGEIVVALLRKDHLWSPLRGRWVTFAEQVCRSRLSELRAKARVVHAPSNAKARLDEYRKRRDAGTITLRQERTLEALEAAFADVGDLSPLDGPLTGDGIVPGEIVQAEDRAAAAVAVKANLREAGPVGAFVLAHLFGLNGLPELSEKEVRLKLPGRNVAAEAEKAKGAIRARIERAKARG